MQPNPLDGAGASRQGQRIDKKVLVQTLEQAIMTAAKKVFGLEREMEAQFNEDSGQVDLFQVCIVTDSVDVKGRDIAKVDADRNGLRADIGDELLFQIFYTDGDADKAEEQQRKNTATSSTCTTPSSDLAASPRRPPNRSSSSAFAKLSAKTPSTNTAIAKAS